ncbi:acyltransferase family protein [Burkholderia sp. NLJ2]|uniref:acyltransferase family protein n=1 Tax=Burkholderia sp. NLJ2 TaxID=3090699 RepID=UPI003C6CA855
MTLHLPALFPWARFSHGYLAVDLFFVMSGFVLARTYESRLLDQRMTTFQFMRARFIRLYPLYILGALLGALSFVILGLFDAWPAGSSWAGLAKVTAFAVVMLPVPRGGALYPLNSPSWSLFFELVANLLFGRFVAVLSNRVLVAVVAITLMLVVWLTSHDAFNGGWKITTLPVGLVRVVFSFSVGVLVHRHTGTVRKPGNVLTLLVMLAIAAVLAVDVTGHAERIYTAVVVALLFPAIVIVATRIEPSGVVRTFCSYSGTISYGLYVLHCPTGNLVTGIEQTALHANARIVGLSGIAFTLCIALFVLWLDRGYDPALRRALGRIIPGSARGMRPGSAVM